MQRNRLSLYIEALHNKFIPFKSSMESSDESIFYRVWLHIYLCTYQWPCNSSTKLRIKKRALIYNALFYYRRDLNDTSTLRGR